MTISTTPPGDDDLTDEAGFTLLEVLVVIAILGLLVGLVAPAVLRQLGGARDSVAHQSIQRLGTILDIYRLDVGTYPSTEEGLQALTTQPAGVVNWKGPYLQGEKQPLDPWNHPYAYRNPSTRSGHDYDVCSGGADGRNADPGGPGAICNP